MLKPYNEKIKLDLLDLNPKNYRIFGANNQNETIKLMVESEDYHLVDLGKDIIEEGLSPIDLLAVIKQPDSNRYTVIEGNRRLTAIRLLENPKLAQNSEIEEKFAKIRDKYLANPIEDIACVVFENDVAPMKWADRKQGTGMGGAGLRKAGYVQNAIRNQQKGKFDKWYAALIFLRDNGFLIKNEFPERKIDNYKIGAVIERVFVSSYFLENLGINITSKGAVTFDNGDNEAGGKLLYDILYELIELKPSTKQFMTSDDQIEYLEKYSERSLKQVKKSVGRVHSFSRENPSVIKAEKPTYSSNDKVTDEVKPTFTKDVKPRVIKVKPLRKKLVPTRKNTGLNIEHKRINELYHALRKLQITEDKLGQRVYAGVTFRVFLELTITHYLKVKKLPQTDGFGSWDDQRATITKKLTAILDDIDPKPRKPELLNVRRALNDGYPLSIQALNEQVHSLEARTLTQNECIECWDRYEPLFELIFSRINDGI